MSVVLECIIVIFKQDTAYDMRISDWSSYVCSSDLLALVRRVQTINVDSLFLGCRTALPLMRQSGEGGSIINLNSIQALRPAAELAAYSASKAAVRALTKSVALHAARDRIRCNSEIGRAHV